MKKICVLLACVCLAFALVGCGEAEYLRIHIRAHSNASADQAVKLAVRDAIVDHLTPLLQGRSSLAQAVRVAEDNADELGRIATAVLQDSGFSYGASVRVSREFFPTRAYGDLTLASGVYDALIVELGSAQGDNWWCIAYPPLCFGGGGKAQVKSWIWERLAELFEARRV